MRVSWRSGSLFQQIESIPSKHKLEAALATAEHDVLLYLQHQQLYAPEHAELGTILPTAFDECFPAG